MQPGALALFPPTRTGTFSVPLDHFRYRLPAPRFNLRYAAYETFAANRSTAPVLFYCGNEGALELFYNASGAVFEHARALEAYAFFVEHRYYGKSLPFGGNASFSQDNLQWLSIEQALADYASILTALPTILGCAGTGPRAAARRCDVVLFGGSYGGMLAAWHRLKFPWLSVGAIASGAPIDFYPADPAGKGGVHDEDDVQARFYDAVVSTFERYGGDSSCGAALGAALRTADQASVADLAAAGVRPCEMPFEADDVERFAFYARGALADIALVDYPYPADFIAPLPANPVREACAQLVSDSSARVSPPLGGAPPPPLAADSSPVHTLQSLLRTVLLLTNATRDLRCLDLRSELVGGSSSPSRSAWLKPPSPATRRGSLQLQHSIASSTPAGVGSSDLGVRAWNYQACTELILEPITSDGFGFYPPAAAQIPEAEASCRRRFGVEPRPGWMRVAFGNGADAFQLSSNLIFMENDKDPWHVGTRTVPATGGLDGSVTRMVAKGGAHHQDLRFSSPLDSPDVQRARAFERAQMRRWLSR